MDGRFVDDGDGGEQLPADLGQEADGGDRLLDAPPPPAGPVEHRPHEREAGPFAGEPAFTLRRVSPKVRSMKFECRMRSQWPAGNRR